MESIAPDTTSVLQQSPSAVIKLEYPFMQEWVCITKYAHIELTHRANYWQAQHTLIKQKCAELEEEVAHRDAKIKDLQKRLFGKQSEKSKKSEKQGLAKPEENKRSTAGRKRGQQPGSSGHGRTPRPDLPVIEEVCDLPENDKHCPTCGLPHLPKPALEKHSDFYEVEVSAHIRRIRRPAYCRNPGCCCPETPAIITAPSPSRLIPRSPYSVSFWVEVLLSKFCYGQPTYRYLQDLSDLALPVSPGTVAGGLKQLTKLFEPILDELYQKQMTETLFHNDETRWEVFVEMEGKIGTRWYLWVTRSESVVFFVLDPSRSADVPGAHFAGLHSGQCIIICDRYSAYKKLARLLKNILLAFCWAHVRRDFLNAGCSYKQLEAWALEWKACIGKLYHHNHQRLDHWDAQSPLNQQSELFDQHHQAIQKTLHAMQQEAIRLSTQNDDELENQSLPQSARNQQRKVCQSLLNHWEGLTLFADNPQVPLDNNLAENTIRGPVTGRKNYYGSGSLWSADLAAALFSILKTLALWGINPRHWLTNYLTVCAKNGGNVPVDVTPYIPWKMNKVRRDMLSRPPPVSPAPADTS